MAKDKQQTEEELIKAIQDLTDEEKEKRLVDDALRRNRRRRFRGELLQTESAFEEADATNAQNLGRVMSERMFRGDSTGQALKGAIQDKIWAKYKNVSKMWNPLNLLSKVPGIGAGLATAYGMKTGKSAADISYFTGAGRFLPSDRDFGGAAPAEKISKIPSVENQGSQATSLTNVKTPVGVLKKTHKLLEMWRKEDKKWKDELKKEKQIDDNFKEEQDMERHRELIRALTGKESKLKGKYKKKEEKEEEFGTLDFIKNMAMYEIGKKVLTRLIPELLGAPAILAAITGALGYLTVRNLSSNQQQQKEAANIGDTKKIEQLVMESNQFESALSGAPFPYAGDPRQATAQKLKQAAQGGSSEAAKAYDDYMKQHPDLKGPKPVSRFGMLGDWWNKKYGDDKTKSMYSKLSGTDQEVVDFFRSRNWSEAVARGILANLKRESGLDPTAEGDFKNGVYQAYGIAQWHPDRQKRFEDTFKKPIKNSSFREQLEFIDWELRNPAYEGAAGNALKSAETPDEAARIFSNLYERPGDKVGEAQIRGNMAMNLGDLNKDTATPISKPDELSFRANGAINENKSLTGDASSRNVSPVIINQVNNQGGGKASAPIMVSNSTDTRNNEPVLLRSQYWNTKPV